MLKSQRIRNEFQPFRINILRKAFSTEHFSFNIYKIMQDQEQIQENIQSQTQETEQVTQPVAESVQVPIVEESGENPTFLKGYEISNFKLSPRIYKILALSAAVNLLFIFAFAQGNLLTRKGCESPFVRTVCGVLDTVYVATMVYDTDSQYVVKEYDKTEIGDAEITYIDVSGEAPPLTYPAGYFALANPEQYAQTEDGSFTNLNVPQTIDTYPTNPINPPFPSNSPNLMDMPQTLPPVNKSPVIGNLPDSPIGKTLPGRRGRKENPTDNDDSPTDSPENEATADKDANKEKSEGKKDETKQPEINSDAVTAVAINKKPFEDFATMVLAKTSSEEKPDLTKPFMVVMQGVINKDGTLNRKKSKFIRQEGDEEMINLSKSAIAAIGDSGILGYLGNLDVNNVNFTLVQDDEKIFAIITSSQPTPERANTITSGFNGLVKGAFLLDSNNIKKLGDDEKILLKNAKATSKGKDFILKFEMPKKDAHEMIQRNLEKERQKRKQQENSTAQKTNPNPNAGK